MLAASLLQGCARVAYAVLFIFILCSRPAFSLYSSEFLPGEVGGTFLRSNVHPLHGARFTGSPATVATATRTGKLPLETGLVRGMAAGPGDVEHVSSPALVHRDHFSHLIFLKSPSTALKSRSPVTNSVFLVLANAAANASASLIGWDALNRAAMSASSRVTG